MAKFMVLYNAQKSAKEIMDNSTPDEVETSMNEWKVWREAANKKATIDFGLPLQNIGHLTVSGVGQSVSNVSGYSTVEADDQQTVMDVFADHPHLKYEGNSIDVFEMLVMTGMDS